MANRLNDATSPYLQQHADNPVDWWPWSDDAFAEARRRDVPVLLSVGYAACHWCHVMAHESFEDPQTAELVNRHLVSIKVDREERPDVDAVYMAATQAMTGQGGWPMTVFMTPDGDPFYCGTYYPREVFQRLVQAVAKAWQENRAEVTGQAGRISAALVANAKQPPVLSENLEQLTERAGAALTSTFDRVNGGFGSAPKFPPSMVVEFLLRHHERTGSPDAMHMAEATCEAMARGGIYDQLGGGFARYSVDERWVVPHFEKMLYDNALLAGVYTHLWRRTGSDLARRVAEETCDFLLRELRTPQGGLAASLDADSEGMEGAFYVWDRAQLHAALGPDDGDFACSVFAVTESGTFEHGLSVLQRLTEPAPAEQERLSRIRGALSVLRDSRPRPARDDKVVAAWNGLAMGALAQAGILFGRQDLITAATDIALLLTSVHLRDGRLARTSRDGVASSSVGQLEDYACVASGLLSLSGVTGEGRWVSVASELLDVVLSSFASDSGFYDTPADGEQLIFRPTDPADGPTPAGASAAADALISYAALTGSARHRTAAGEALRTLPAVASAYPRAAGAGLAVAEAMISGPAEVAVVGPVDDSRTLDLLRAGLHLAPPGAVFAVGPEPYVPLLDGRGLVNGGPAAYVCRNFTCKLPARTPAELRPQLT